MTSVDVLEIDAQIDPAGLYAALTSSISEVVILFERPGGLNDRAIDLLAEVFSDPDVVAAYSDETVLDRGGRHLWSSYKPDWSPERLRSQYYIGDLLAVRRLCALAAVLAIATDDSYATPRGTVLRWDLMLRLTEHGGKVTHIPETLFGRRATDAAAADLALSAAVTDCAAVVRAHCERMGIAAEVRITEPGGVIHLHRDLDPSTKVSLIIPTCGSSGVIWGQERIFLIELVESILEKATWTNVEFVIVADTTTPPHVRTAIRSLCGDRLVWVDYDKEFNFSDKINRGRRASTGDVLLLLNDDMEVIAPSFIEELVGLALDPGVGAVGARLLLEDGRIQHIGHRYAEGTFHLFAGYDGDYAGPERMCLVTRECVGVTAACLAVQPEVFDAVGGMALDSPNNFNDVDFSLRLRAIGLRNIVTPHATLFHFESVTRDGTVTAEEAHLLFTRWGDELSSDPYSNPNLEPGRIEWIEKPTR